MKTMESSEFPYLMVYGALVSAWFGRVMFVNCCRSNFELLAILNSQDTLGTFFITTGPLLALVNCNKYR